ncbi:hypothetical protein JD508_21855 [Aeromonas jandaei]|uniref:hypothetical protein n=1 Tax=Aeromonas jandaei TaxID=650 RepID=UPI00191F7A8D|nr:hypothetical protein [Aeromonas jandaei]MBL0612861.1 hypothetical protein [Aeromonas jandaei]
MNRKNKLLTLCASLVGALGSANVYAADAAINRGPSATLDISITATSVTSHTLSPNKTEPYTAQELEDIKYNTQFVAEGEVVANGKSNIAVSWEHPIDGEEWCSYGQTDSKAGVLQLCITPGSGSNSLIETSNDPNKVVWYSIGEGVESAKYKIRVPKSGNNIEKFLVGKYTYMVNSATYVK